VAAAAFIAPFLSDQLARWIAMPSVVLEILLGVLLGPVVLGWAHQGEVVTAISDLGLSMLMFLAGYEIDFGRIRGRPLRLAITGWLISLAAGLVIAGGIVVWLHGSSTDDLVAHQNAAALVIGLAITTTALGTILPPLRDAGLLLTTDNPARTALLLVGFVALALGGLWLATRKRPPLLVRLVTATLGTSGRDHRQGVPQNRRQKGSRGRRVQAGRHRVRVPGPVLLRDERGQPGPEGADFQPGRCRDDPRLPGAIPAGARDPDAGAAPP
jgi:hypothetical protein